MINFLAVVCISLQFVNVMQTYKEEQNVFPQLMRLIEKILPLIIVIYAINNRGN